MSNNYQEEVAFYNNLKNLDDSDKYKAIKKELIAVFGKHQETTDLYILKLESLLLDQDDFKRCDCCNQINDICELETIRDLQMDLCTDCEIQAEKLARDYNLYFLE